ncbi:MAG TPA: hypothetical protein VNU64_05840, partial [Burkholderiales bacterium]|nr:hypothetical protein [Burkholderiales bacterium]
GKQNRRWMESVSQLLKELEPVREASTREAGQAFVEALWRRSHAEIADLSVQFAQAGLSNLAAMCRTVAAARGKR